MNSCNFYIGVWVKNALTLVRYLILCGSWFILSLASSNQGSLLTQTLNQIVLDMENGIYKYMLLVVS